jgi:hypothetical protein
MRRSAVIAFAAVFALGVVALVAVAGLERRSEAFTLGVIPAAPLEVRGGGTVCQLPIDVPESFDEIRFQVGTHRRTGPPLTVTVRDPATDLVQARALVAGGYPDVSTLGATVSPVRAGRTVAVCIRNDGRHRIALYGNATPASRSSNAYLEGRDTGADISLVFIRPESASLLTLVPDMVDHGSLFHGGWVGAWTFWALIPALLLGLPALLLVALRATRADVG